MTPNYSFSDSHCYSSNYLPNGRFTDEAPLVEPVETLMEEARKSSIFRTVHAGEVSGPESIERVCVRCRTSYILVIALLHFENMY